MTPSVITKKLVRRFIVVSALWAARVSAETLPPVNRPIFEIPKLEAFAADGRTNEWGGAGFSAGPLVMRTGGMPRPDDFDPRMKLGWTARGLAILIRVRDNHIRESADADFWSRGDSVEAFLAGNWKASGHYRIILRPGLLDPASPRPVSTIIDRRSETNTPITCEVAAAPFPGGYLVELLMPWAPLGVAPTSGAAVAFTVQVNDMDTATDTERRMAIWYPEGWGSSGASKMHWLRLGSRSQDPFPLACRREVRAADGLVEYTFWGDAALVGRRVEIAESNVVVASAPLASVDDRARAILDVPLPAMGTTWRGPGEYRMGDFREPFAWPDPVWERTRALRALELTFDRYVFAGDEWPVCAFANPRAPVHLLGEYRMETRFYNAAFQPVARADQPGRYGAIVTVRQGTNTVLRRRVTLYRQPGASPDWHGQLLPEGAGWPDGLGIDPIVATAQRETLDGLVKDALRHFLATREDGAIVLAGLSETPAHATPATARNDVWRRNQEWWYRLGRSLGEPGVPYFVTTPTGYDSQATQRWPVILFLHGAGERGNNLESVRKVGLPAVAAGRPAFPFILVCPQCPAENWWSPAPLLDILDEVARQYHVDPERVYLTGLSMGGFGTWSLLAEQTGRFAAAAPICGGGDPREAEFFRDVPVWVFHGEKDSTVPLVRSQEMVDALRRFNAPVGLTVYPNIGHNSWDEAYRNDRLYDWFLANRLGHPVSPVRFMQGAD